MWLLTDGHGANATLPAKGSRERDAVGRISTTHSGDELPRTPLSRNEMEGTAKMGNRRTTSSGSVLDFQRVVIRALSRAPQLVPSWLPEGRKLGEEWVARNPRRNDRRPGSFKVNLRSGRWADFATGDAGGDLISLRAYLDGIRQGEAARRITREIGA